MSLSKTLAQLRTAAKVRAGMNSTGTSVDLTDAVLNDLVNDAVYEAWDVITNKFLDYYTTTANVSMVTSTRAYAVPTLFHKFRALWMPDGERRIRMRPIALEAAHSYVGQTVGTRGDYRYLIMNREISIWPLPAESATLTLYYVPIKAELTADGDTVTFDTPVELKYVLSTIWRDILDRQNLDPSPAIAKMQAYEAKLRTAADGLDAAEPYYLNPYGPRVDDEDLAL